MVVVQLAVVFTLIVFLVSSIGHRLRLYLPFEKEFTSKGQVMTFSPIDFSWEEGERLTKETIMEGNDGISNIVSGNQMAYDFVLDGRDETLNVIAYERDVYTRYRPYMESGGWLGEAPTEPGYINAVITKNEFHFDTGDVIDGYFYDVHSDQVEYKIRIVGKIKNGARVMGTGEVDTDLNKEDYRSFYNIVNPMQTFHSYLFVDLEDVKANQLYYSISRGKALVTYRDDITEEERWEVESYLRNYGEAILTLEEINDRSVKFIWEQMYLLLPITIGILVLVLTGMFSISAIQTKKQLRNYGVFIT